MPASAGVAQPVPNEGSGLERILFGQIEDLFPWRNTGFPFGRNFQFLAFQFSNGADACFNGRWSGVSSNGSGNWGTSDKARRPVSMGLSQGKSVPSHLGCCDMCGLLTSCDGPSTNKYAGHTDTNCTLSGIMSKTLSNQLKLVIKLIIDNVYSQEKSHEND